MQRRVVSRFALFLGGLAAVVSWWSFAAHRTVFDPVATREAALGVLESTPVRDKAVTSLSEQLDRLLPPGATTAQRNQTRLAASRALTDPRLRTAFADAIASVHEQLLTKGGSPDKLVIDTRAVTKALRDALASVDPALARQLADQQFRVSFDTSNIPNLHAASSAVPDVALLAALAAIAFWALAILFHPDPSVAVRRVGRRLVALGLGPVIVFIVLPAVLRAFKPDAAATLTPFARSYGSRLAPAATVIVIVGAGVWLAGRFGRIAGRRSKPGAAGPAPSATITGGDGLAPPRVGVARRRGPVRHSDRVDVKL
jgi:hypothetical protein